MGSVEFNYEGTLVVEDDSMSVYVGDQDLIELFLALQGEEIRVRVEVEGL